MIIHETMSSYSESRGVALCKTRSRPKNLDNFFSDYGITGETNENNIVAAVIQQSYSLSDLSPTSDSDLGKNKLLNSVREHVLCSPRP